MSYQATESDKRGSQQGSQETEDHDQAQGQSSETDGDNETQRPTGARDQQDSSSAQDEGGEERTDGSDHSDSSGQNGSSRGISAGEAIKSAREVIAELTGKQPEGVSAINRSSEGGWVISLDVLVLNRIPASTDLLATYEVSLDGEGFLVDMERTRRYARNQVDED